MTPAGSSATADEIRALSEQQFRWAADGEIDRFADLLDDNLAFVHLTGQISSKAEWVAQLRAGAYGYREMKFVDCDVHVHGNTAVLVGRVDILAASGHTWRLAVTEVYVKSREAGSWSAPTPARDERRLPPLLWTAMKEGLLGGTLDVSPRSESKEARLHVARWAGSESKEDRRLPAVGRG
jgi:hypothetical protein